MYIQSYNTRLRLHVPGKFSATSPVDPVFSTGPKNGSVIAGYSFLSYLALVILSVIGLGGYLIGSEIGQWL